MAAVYVFHNNKKNTEKAKFQQREKKLFESVSLSEVYARHPQLNRTEDLRDFLLAKEHGELPAIVLFDTDGNERDNEGIAKAFHIYHHHHNNSGNVTRTKSTRTKSRSRSLSRSRSRSSRLNILVFDLFFCFLCRVRVSHLVMNNHNVPTLRHYR